jgi:hypothetical protein
MSEIERFRGCYVRVSRDEFRPNIYSVYFEGGLQQARGLNNPAPVFRRRLRPRLRSSRATRAFAGAFTPKLMKPYTLRKHAR